MAYLPHHRPPSKEVKLGLKAGIDAETMEERCPRMAPLT